jgi:hypothetical protein
MENKKKKKDKKLAKKIAKKVISEIGKSLARGFENIGTPIAKSKGII